MTEGGGFADWMPLIIVAVVAFMILMAMRPWISALLRRYGRVGIKEVHYNINQKTVKQIKASCRQNRDKELKRIIFRKDPFARTTTVLYRGHCITPKAIFVLWKKKIIGFAKPSIILHNMFDDLLGTDMVIEANAFFNHDLIWFPVPTQNYLAKYKTTERAVFMDMFSAFDEAISKQFQFDLENIGAENVVRGASMSQLWKAMIQAGDELPHQAAMPSQTQESEEQ